ncbi:hypothetical protein OQA88_9036 [Cercophora sp. LCS_1]
MSRLRLLLPQKSEPKHSQLDDRKHVGRSRGWFRVRGKNSTSNSPGNTSPIFGRQGSLNPSAAKRICLSRMPTIVEHDEIQEMTIWPSHLGPLDRYDGVAGDTEDLGEDARTRKSSTSSQSSSFSDSADSTDSTLTCATSLSDYDSAECLPRIDNSTVDDDEITIKGFNLARDEAFFDNNADSDSNASIITTIFSTTPCGSQTPSVFVGNSPSEVDSDSDSGDDVGPHPGERWFPPSPGTEISNLPGSFTQRQHRLRDAESLIDESALKQLDGMMQAERFIRKFLEHAFNEQHSEIRITCGLTIEQVYQLGYLERDEGIRECLRLFRAPFIFEEVATALWGRLEYLSQFDNLPLELMISRETITGIERDRRSQRNTPSPDRKKSKTKRAAIRRGLRAALKRSSRSPTRRRVCVYCGTGDHAICSIPGLHPDDYTRCRTSRQRLGSIFKPTPSPIASAPGSPKLPASEPSPKGASPSFFETLRGRRMSRQDDQKFWRREAALSKQLGKAKETTRRSNEMKRSRELRRESWAGKSTVKSSLFSEFLGTSDWDRHRGSF